MTMTVTCKDRDRIFEDGSPAEWAELEAHAANCPSCFEEVEAWKSLSVAAKELRHYEDSPSSWPRIEKALAEVMAQDAQRNRATKWWSFQGFSLSWQTAIAGAFVVLLAVSAGWIYFSPRPPKDNDPSLLKTSALKEVQSTESAYEHAIDKLASQAKPQLDDPTTPLMASYHEKLLVLDSAIGELRAQAGLNPSNAQLRYQLLAMYQEKQRTLEEVLEAKPQ